MNTNIRMNIAIVEMTFEPTAEEWKMIIDNMETKGEQILDNKNADGTITKFIFRKAKE